MALMSDQEMSSIPDIELEFGEELFIGDDLRKCLEGNLCGECGPGSNTYSPEGTGAHTPLPTTILAPGMLNKGAEPGATVGPGFSLLTGSDDMIKGVDTGSGARTPPQMEVMQRLLEMHLEAPWMSPLSPCDPSVVDVLATDATALPSVGSKGHPYNCAAACKYVKRKGGCRRGAECELCHSCFWQRERPDDEKNSIAQQAKLSETASDPQPAPAKTEDVAGTSEVRWASIGSQNHPYGCGPACKHTRRKGGCREGANCPNCHECHWRRGQENRQSSIGLSTKTTPGFDSTAVSVLQKLIHLQMEKAAAEQDHLLPSQSVKSDGQKQIESIAPEEDILIPRPTKLLNNQEQPQEKVPSVGSMGHPFNCNLPCKYNGKRSGCKEGLGCTRCHLCHWSRMAVRSASNAVKSLSL